MIYFYTQLYSQNMLYLIYFMQTLPALIVYLTAVKYGVSLKVSRSSIVLLALPPFFLGMVFNIIIQKYFQEVMVVHNIFTIQAQFIMLFIMYLIFYRGDLRLHFQLLVITILTILCAGIFEYIRFFLLNFSNLPLFSIHVVNWYFLLFLLLLPLLGSFLRWAEHLFNQSPTTVLLINWTLLIALLLFQLFVQISSLTQASEQLEFNSIIFLSSSHLGISLVKRLAPTALLIIEPVNEIFPFGTSLIVGVTVVLSIIFFLLFLNNYNKQKLAQQEQLKYELTQYIGTLETMTKNIRKNHHDFSNILFSLGGLIYQSPVDERELKKYYEAVTETFEEDYQYFLEVSKLKNIGVPELKTLIFTKLMTATKKGIPFDIEIEQPVQQLPLDQLSLSRVCGILMDNALEAAEESPQPYVRLAVIDDEACSTFILVNSTKHKDLRRLLDQEDFSTKGENRGLGLSIVRTILQKHSNKVSLKTTQHENEIRQTLIFRKGD